MYLFCKIEVNAYNFVLVGGAKNKQSKAMRWPWIIVTVAVCGVDLVAAVIYANESFLTRVNTFMQTIKRLSKHLVLKIILKITLGYYIPLNSVFLPYVYEPQSV